MRPSLLFAALLAAPLAAQQPGAAPTPAVPPTQRARPITLAPALKPPVADTGIFSPIGLPPANRIRSATGAPGLDYWQQQADYTIKATLDTVAKRLTGTEEIRYTNHSPDTLRFVWIQLDQNLFRPGSAGLFLNGPESRYGVQGFAGGFEISTFIQTSLVPSRAGQVSGPDGQRPSRRARERSSDRLPAPLKTRTDDTMMFVELAAPLPPGAVTTLEVAYAFNIPEHGADRMGRDGGLYQIAQWYPRLAVYDDVHGWNTDRYLGQGEFYLEYGTIQYQVTVPAGYIVAGTGMLQNPLEVLTPAQRTRLAAAARSDTTVAIITAEELASGEARPKQEGTLTWHFRADRVRDVAWAASPDYQWDATAWSSIVAHAYYRPSAAVIWKDAAQMTRFSIREYSNRWFRYPYPQVSAVEGLVSGMEYPMVAMEARSEDTPGLYNVLTHEVGHMWFPMIVGSDERRHAWMDEGFTTFLNTFSEEEYWKRDDSDTRRSEIRFVTGLDQGQTPQPIMTPANRYRNSNLGSLAYVKPSIALLTLRDKVLGPELFDPAFREYIRRWAFKHPQPADFFRTMEEMSGRDLAWFWRGFFFTTSALDQSVETVTQAADSSAQIVLRNLGAAVMPVELELGLADGTAQLIKLPVEIWYAGDRYIHRMGPGKPIMSARVNPDGMFPDIMPGNDTWTRPAAATP